MTDSLRAHRWLSAALLSAACAVTDRDVPWKRDDMVADASSDLRRFERIGLDQSTAEVLAWRTIERSQILATPPGLPAVVHRRRADGALLWARGGLRTGASGWLLVDVVRWDDEQWTRSLINREFSAPPPSLRPGETTDGTWHGVAEYTHPPTSREICEFAKVSFLAPGPDVHDGAGLVKSTGGVQQQAWRRVTRDEPACDGWPQMSTQPGSEDPGAMAGLEPPDTPDDPAHEGPGNASQWKDEPPIQRVADSSQLARTHTTAGGPPRHYRR